MERGIIDVYDKSIFENKDVFTHEFCSKVIEKFEQSPNKTIGETSHGRRLETKQTLDLNMCKDYTNEFYIKIYEQIDKYLEHVKKIDHNDELRRIIKSSIISIPRISKTTKGGYYDWHSDFDPFEKSVNRVLAIIVYLNNVDEDDGGSTEFNSGKKIQPEIGKILIFPADWFHLHRGNMVKKNVKYIVATFLGINVSISTEKPKTNIHEQFPFIIS